MKNVISKTIGFGLVAALLGLGGTTATAQSSRILNKVTVNAAGGDTFEVVEGSNHLGAQGMWCGAATYAKANLGISGTTRIYVQTPRGNAVTAPGRKGVLFGLSVPAGAAPSDVFSVGASIRQPGANMSHDVAVQFCHFVLAPFSR